MIDPVSFKVIDHFAVGRQPQHVTPSYNLEHLWVLNDLGDSVTEIDPATGRKGKTVRVKDPSTCDYTPDGQFAVVVAERESKLNFLNPATMKLTESVPVPCRGVDHMDFGANGRFLIASCEFSASLVKVDVITRRALGTLALEAGGMPQDVRSSPDGKLFYVADMAANGVYVIDPYAFTRVEFIPTGKGAHGISISRDATADVRVEPGRGERVRDRPGHAETGCKVGHPGRGQSRHGWFVGRRGHALVIGPLQRRGLRVRYQRRAAAGAHQGREGAARPGRLSATGSILARTQRRVPLSPSTGCGGRPCLVPGPWSATVALICYHPRMTKEVTLRQAGGSVSATLPKDMADRLRLEAGDRILAVETDRGILLTPYDPDAERALKIAAKAAKKYRNALRELAK